MSIFIYNTIRCWITICINRRSNYLFPLFTVLVLVAVQMVLAALMWGATSDDSMRYYDAEMRDGWIRLVDQGYIARRADGCVGEASAICLDICPSKWLRALQEKHDCCAYDDASSTLQNPTDCGCTAVRLKRFQHRPSATFQHTPFIIPRIWFAKMH